MAGKSYEVVRNSVRFSLYPAVILVVVIFFRFLLFLFFLSFLLVLFVLLVLNLVIFLFFFFFFFFSKVCRDCVINTSLYMLSIYIKFPT